RLELRKHGTAARCQDGQGGHKGEGAPRFARGNGHIYRLRYRDAGSGGEASVGSRGDKPPPAKGVKTVKRTRKCFPPERVPLAPAVDWQPLAHYTYNYRIPRLLGLN